MIDFNRLKPSASMEMTQKANSLRNKGFDVLNLSIGDTHFNLPASLKGNLTAVPEIASHYGEAQGLFSLREQIAEEYDGVNATNVIIVPGLKQGLFYLISSLGKFKVAVLEPAWLGYQATCVLAGVEYIGINTYECDWIEALANEDFDVLIICSPNNPDGEVLSIKDSESILNIVKTKDAFLVVDKIYEKFIYDKSLINSKNFIPQDRIIIAGGFSKSHAMTGHRVGFLVITESSLAAKIIRIQQNLATCPSNYSQHLLSTCVHPVEVNDFVRYYQANVSTVLELFPEWETHCPKGGFYFFVDLKRYGIFDAEKFCLDLLDSHKISLVSGNAYGAGFESFVRISICVEEQTLRNALVKLKYVLNDRC